MRLGGVSRRLDSAGRAVGGGSRLGRRKASRSTLVVLRLDEGASFVPARVHLTHYDDKDERFLDYPLMLKSHIFAHRIVNGGLPS